MRKGWAYKTFVCFVCFSFLSLVSGFPRVAVEAKDRGRPAGEMISTGGVKFEARENVWKKVESAHFPIFEGVRLKTENGLALIVLPDNSRVEVGQSSLFSLQHDDQFRLFQGQLSFRIPSTARTTFKVGQLSIRKSLPLQAAKSPLPVSSRTEEAIGSVRLHSDGSVTVKSIRGPLSIEDADHVVFAAISSNESVTIPAAAVSGTQGKGVTLAQVGEVSTAAGGEVMGLSTSTWMLIGLGAVAVGIGVAVVASDDDDDDREPICP